MDDFKLLSKIADEIGGDDAISYVDKSYVGNCKVIKTDGSGDCVVEVHPTKLPITHKNFPD